MAGIVSYGAYVPRFRLGKESKGWELPAEKATANFDEDGITMAVAAGIDCLKGQDRSQVDALLFATTTSPYLEKQAASTIATALDLKRSVFTSDITNSLRGGTIALRTALDSVKAGSAKRVLVIAADTRKGPPKGEFDRNAGDGAAALLLGDAGAAVEVEDCSTISEHMMDVWRTEGETFVRSWEDRFVIEEGYQRLLPEAVKTLLKQKGLEPKDITKAAYYAPDSRRHSEMARMLGLQPPQVQDPLFGKLGNTGTAFSLTLLVAALEEVKAGDRILLASYGDGSDAFLLRVTPQIEKARKEGKRGIKGYLNSKQILPTYDEYVRWFNLMPSEAARRPAPSPASVSALWRERDEIIRLYGGKCKNCGTIQYPPQEVCTRCHQRKGWEGVRLSDKKASIFTYSMDYIAGTTDVPLVITVVNFDGGGRGLFMMTDRLVSEVKVGLPVEMSFRKLRTVAGVHNYFWKTVPIR